MPAFPFDVVAFDLDGILADTAPDLTAALNHALTCFGRPELAPAEVRHLVGHGARALLRRGLAVSGDAPEDVVDVGFPIFIDHYRANICRGTRAYLGVEAALEALSSRGARLAVCTTRTNA